MAIFYDAGSDVSKRDRSPPKNYVNAHAHEGVS